MLSRDEKYIARILLKSKIFESDGQAFENLFCRVMELLKPGFERIKPQGPLGDRKNDGFIKDQGIYFQVYAPENPQHSEGKAIKKLQQDFAGLKAYWSDIAPIQVFHFVFNDKFKGSYPKLESTLAQLKKDNPKIEFNCFRAKDLEDHYLQLDEQHQIEIVGPIPSPEKIEQVDYSPMGEIIHHILKHKTQITNDLSLNVPDFEQKIQFNHLGKVPTAILDNCSLQAYAVNNFFSLNSMYTKQEICRHLHALYNQAVTEKPPGEDADWVFIHLLNKIAPKQSISHYTAAQILMAYFFETCDIFKEPS